MTLIVAPDEGVTHWPPMKNRSGCRIGTLMSFARLIWAPSRRPDSHIVTRSLDRRDVAAKGVADNRLRAEVGRFHKAAREMAAPACRRYHGASSRTVTSASRSFRSES